MKFEVRGDDGGGEFRVCCCTGTGTPYLRRYVMKLLTILEDVSATERANEFGA